MKKQIRLGVIGGGDFSAYHLNGIENSPNAVAVAICDLDRERALEKAKMYGISEENVYTDYHDLIARDDIDAVTIPLPDQFHKDATVDALRAGKHVLCEKPMALNLDECKEMIKVAKETGKQLMVGQLGRYTPAFVQAKKMIDDGVIGELFMIESEYAHDYSEIGGNGTQWRVTPEREPIIGGGCHAVDLIRMIAGNPEEVFGYANNKCLTTWPIHDCTMAVMKLPNGVIGKVMTSTGCKRNYTMRTVAYGTKGTIIFDNKTPTISLFKGHFTDDPDFDGYKQRELEVKLPVVLNDHNFGGEVQDFCRCILEDEPVPTTGVEGASTVSVCLAIVESFKTGEKVKPDYNF